MQKGRDATEPVRRPRRRVATAVVVLALVVGAAASACSAPSGRVDEGPQHSINVGWSGLTPKLWVYVHARPVGQLVWLHRFNNVDINATRDFVLQLNIIPKSKTFCAPPFGRPCQTFSNLGKTQWRELWGNQHHGNLNRIRDLLQTLAFFQALHQNNGGSADYSSTCLEIESKGIGGSTKWSPLSKATNQGWWNPASVSGCNWGQKVSFD